MATAPPTPDPRTRVRVTERLWSEEVELARAGEELKPGDTAYEFSHGRKFVERTDPYQEP